VIPLLTKIAAHTATSFGRTSSGEFRERKRSQPFSRVCSVFLRSFSRWPNSMSHSRKEMARHPEDRFACPNPSQQYLKGSACTSIAALLQVACGKVRNRLTVDTQPRLDLIVRFQAGFPRREDIKLFRTSMISPDNHFQRSRIRCRTSLATRPREAADDRIKPSTWRCAARPGLHRR